MAGDLVSSPPCCSVRKEEMRFVPPSTTAGRLWTGEAHCWGGRQKVIVLLCGHARQVITGEGNRRALTGIMPYGTHPYRDAGRRHVVNRSVEKDAVRG